MSSAGPAPASEGTRPRPPASSVTGVLRFAFAVNGPHVPAWTARCLEALLGLPGLVPVLRLEGSAHGHGPAPGTLAWRLYARFALSGRLLSERMEPMPSALAALAVHRMAPRAPTEDQPALGAEDVAALRRADVAVLLHLGPGPAPRPIPGAPGPAIWYLRVGAHAGGGPEAFAEVADAQPVIEVALVSVGTAGDVVLRRAVLATVLKSYPRTLDAARFTAAALPEAACRAALAGGVASPGGALGSGESPAIAGVPPGAGALAVFLWRGLGHRVRDLLRWLVLHRQWNVGVVDAPIHAFLQPGFTPRVRWLPAPPRRRFLADPFGLREGRMLTILAEELDQAERRGRIVAVEWPDGGEPVVRRGVLPLPVHASYPFLVEDDGRVYCVPETGAAGEVTLHRAVAFPTRWERVATLATRVAARDASVVRYQGRWWMFYGEDGPQGEAHLCALHALALGGPWVAHAANPLSSDLRSARPGGTPFVHQGTLYRPAQDGTAGYGGAVVIQRVTRLTPTEFEEEDAALVRADPAGQYPLGIHTLSAVGGQTLVDGQRGCFVPALFLGEVGKHLRRLFGLRPAPPPELGGRP